MLHPSLLLSECEWRCFTPNYRQTASWLIILQPQTHARAKTRACMRTYSQTCAKTHFISPQCISRTISLFMFTFSSLQHVAYFSSRTPALPYPLRSLYLSISLLLLFMRQHNFCTNLCIFIHWIPIQIFIDIYSTALVQWGSSFIVISYGCSTKPGIDLCILWQMCTHVRAMDSWAGK